MIALRHNPRIPIVIERQIGQTWICDDGRELIDLSGASLTKTVLTDKHPSFELAQNVTPSSGFESKIKIAAETAVLNRMPWADGCLWASSGSDAIEQAVWAVDSVARREHGKALATYIVRRGGYHGNTYLGRLLSTRGSDITNRRQVDGRTIVVLDERRDTNGAGILDKIQMLDKEIRRPALLLLEPFPTTGRNFVANEKSLSDLVRWCGKHGIYVVFDEVASGAYRHGEFSISERLDDDLCPTASVLSKSMTCGVYPLSVVAMPRSLTSAIRESIQRPVSFTYGLTEYAAAAFLNTLSIYERLIEDGAFERRRLYMRNFHGELHAFGLDVEYTTTTVRISGPANTINELLQALSNSGLWVYAGFAHFSSDSYNRESPAAYGFIHICPLLNIDDGIVEAQCRMVRETIADALRNQYMS